MTSSTRCSLSPIETGPIDESRTTPGGNDGVEAVVVVAVVVAKDNLAECENGGCGSRKTVLFVDSKATEA